MTIAVFHPGMQHSRQTALALQQLGRLAFFATGIFDHEKSPWRRATAIAPAGVGRAVETLFARFATPGLDPALVRDFPLYELPERVLAKTGFAALARAFDRKANDRFGRRVAGLAKVEGAAALWGYDNSSLSAFTDPRSKEAVKILDRTIADWREWNAIVGTIEDTHGDWLDSSIRRAPRWLIERGEAEFAAADHILCGSDYVVETIVNHSAVAGVAGKLRKLPYCFDTAGYGSLPQPRLCAKDEPVRFLFAGQLSARKGIHHVLEAIEHLSPDEAVLTCVGPSLVPDAMLGKYADRVEFLGNVSRQEMPAIMARHDALVLPSYFEGSAIVLLEAMAAGLATISTPQAGAGPSAMSGIRVARPDTELVAGAMKQLAQDRERLFAMRKAARAEASAYDHSAYCCNIAAMLGDMGI